MHRLAPRWQLWCATALLLAGRREAALLRLNLVCSRFPDDVHALASRAHLLVQCGRAGEALQDSRCLVLLRSGDAGTWFNHGFLLEATGQWDEARAAFLRATELGPLLDRAWYGLGLVLIRLRRFDEAAVALRRNTELQPQSPCGWYQLARVHVDMNEPKAAARIIQHLQGFEPRIAAQLARETGLEASA